MGPVVAIGCGGTLEGFALAGVDVLRADSPAAAGQAWTDLADDVALVILSPETADAVADRLAERPDVLTVVTP